jgi:chromosome partitioning protein
MNKTLVVTGGKGGTGKTTTAVNLAAELVALGFSVELRDLDPQSSATLALGADPAADPWEAEPVELDGIRLRPGGRLLARIERGERSALELLKNVEPADVRILDCPPTLGLLTTAALEAATLALVPLQPSPLALTALADVAAVLEDLENPPRLRTVLVQVHSRRLLTRDVVAHLEENAPGTLYRAQIPEDARAAEAPGHGLPLRLYAPSSRAAEAYRELAAEVAADLNG